MVPPEYSGFLTAATPASAALIGLLFVSVSLSPELVFGSRAEAAPRALALSSFTALANVFFVSFGSLIPNVSYGYFVLIAGVIAESQTLALLAGAPTWRRIGLVRGATVFAASAAIYGYEIAIGAHLIASPSDRGALTVLLELLFAAFAIGLVRAWELLGAPSGRGLGSGLVLWLQARFRRIGGDAKALREPPPRARRR